MADRLLAVHDSSFVEAHADLWTNGDATLYELPLANAKQLVNKIDVQELSLWRYRSVLPFDDNVERWRKLTLGEGATPLVTAGDEWPGLQLKIEYAAPTLSFKDRGAAVMVAKAMEWNVRRVVTDSSGNAGTALAAYAARAGMYCDVFVPASASPGKLIQMECHGATVHRIEGPRAEATRAAQSFVTKHRVFYASHVYNPYFHEGTKTFAYEVWEQSGFKAPQHVYLPVGHGTLVLGAWKGFRELLEAGLIERMPVLHAAQAKACAPIAEAFKRSDVDVTAIEAGSTFADGIAISAPPRGARILEAIRDTEGDVTVLDDDEIRAARLELARMGWFVEPTAAVPFAAWRRMPREGSVLPLSGAGLKVPGA